MDINPKMPRISHPMNRLDRRSNLVSNREASPVMGPFSQGHWQPYYIEIEESEGIHFYRHGGVKTSI